MKAILVIDMPKDCAECQFCGYGGRNLEKYVCCLTKEHSEGSHLVGCPLKPMPQELPTPYMMRQIMIADGIQTEKPPYTEEYQKGYNDCINEILGGTE